MEHNRPSAFQAGDEMSSRFGRTKTVQIVVASTGEADKLLRLAGQCEQALAEANRDRRILRAVHDQKGRRDACNTLVGRKRILEQNPDRYKRKRSRGNIGDRGVGRFEDEAAKRM